MRYFSANNVYCAINVAETTAKRVRETFKHWAEHESNNKQLNNQYFKESFIRKITECAQKNEISFIDFKRLDNVESVKLTKYKNQKMHATLCGANQKESSPCENIDIKNGKKEIEEKYPELKGYNVRVKNLKFPNTNTNPQLTRGNITAQLDTDSWSENAELRIKAPSHIVLARLTNYSDLIPSHKRLKTLLETEFNGKEIELGEVECAKQK